MSYHLFLLPFAIILIILYWIARKKDDLKKVAVIQPVGTVVSMLIAASAFLLPDSNTALTIWILVGLGIALIGDINNVNMNDDKTVIIGLVIFVFGYMTYAIGLTILNGFHRADIFVGAVLFCVYVGYIGYIWPGLGEWKIPVLIYGLVMPFMVSRAISTFFGTAFSPTQSILLTVGTTMVFVGDMEYGIYRFRKPIPMHFGPILYAGGQLVIALSPCYPLAQ